MANLEMPKLSMKIEADGSSALVEIQKTAQAVSDITQETEKLNAAQQKYHTNAAGKWVDANGRYVSTAKVIEELGEETANLIKENDAAARKAGEFAGETDKAAKSADKLGKSTKTVGERLKEFGDKAEKSFKKIKNSAETVEKTGKTLTKFTTTPIVAALTAAVKSAGDFNETLGKTEVVFGGMTDTVMAWSENSVQAMGLAQSTALEMASTYGDMATGMGLATTEAAEMSMGITQLAADIASFKNKSISDVQASMSGIFTGETESLKQLGIVMTQTNLEAFALSQGITKSISAMTQAEQVQLRYAYVMAQSANAQGDFLRTGDSLNNQTRKLTETLKQVANEFGGPLTEKVAGVVAKLQGAAQWLAELDDGTKSTILNIGMLVAAAGPLLMVGGKLLGMLATMKTTLLAMTANPVVLGVAGVLAVLSALMANTGKGLDKTSKTYQNVKNAVEGGASGEITIDDSQLQELENNPPSITIDADGQNALDEAQSIVDKINNGEYDGAMAIDGDPDEANDALAELQAAITAAKAAMTIDANGNAILQPGGELSRLKSAIARVKAIIPITTDPIKKAQLQSYLNDLTAQLDSLNINASFETSTETEENIQAFGDKLATLPQDETYSVTGEFKISDATTETIEEYAEALAAAATATGDYAEAVDNLNKIVDQETQRKIAEVNEQIAEEAQVQAALLGAGLISEEQAQANTEKALKDGEEKIRQIEQEAEARKKLNETFNNGSASDDAPTAADALLQLYAGSELTQEQQNAYSQQLYDSSKDETIGDEQSQLAAQIQLNALRKEALADQEALTAASEKYQASMSKADTNEQASIENAQKNIDMYTALQEAAGAYYGEILNGRDPEEAMQGVFADYAETLSQFEGSEGIFKEMFTGENGELMGSAQIKQAGEVFDSFDSLIADEQGKIETATEEATTAREAALTEFQTALAGIQEGFTESEAAGALALVEQAGVAVDELDKKMILGGTQAISDLASAIEDGDGDVSAAIQTAMDTIDALGMGNDTSAGMGQGMREYDFAADAETVAQNIENSNRNAGDAHSPARRYIPIGNDVSAGMGQGMREYSFVADAQSVAAAIEAATKAAISASGLTIGKEMTAGVARGIKIGTSAAVAAAIQSAKRVTAAYKKELDIHSPSRVARDEIGLQFARGVGAGIEQGMPDVLRIIRASTEGIVTSASSVNDQRIYSAPIGNATLSIPEFDYERLADAVSKRPIAFSVGARQMAMATRDETARQQAIRVQQINRSYGNGG